MKYYDETTGTYKDIPVIPGTHTHTMSEISDKVDFIVEEGTSNMWEYRKWNSGISECWGITSFSITTNSQLGSLYYSGVDLDNFPFTFINIKSFQSNVYAPNNGIYWTIPYSINNNVSHLWIASADNTTRVIYVYAYVLGRWK